MFGIDGTGFRLKKQVDIKEAIIASLRASFGDGIRVDEKSNFGQLIESFSEELAEVWEVSQAGYALVSPDNAYGILLDNIVQFAGLTRLDETYSVQPDQVVVGDNGTMIPAGSVISQDDTKVRFVTLTDVIIGMSGSAAVDLEAEEAGPVTALAGTLTKIETPVTGWASTTNPTDADPGRNLEGDSALRTRWMQTLQRPGGTSALGIRAELLNLEGVDHAIVIENEGDDTDADGRPMRAYEVLIKGGDEMEIAKTLWANKPAGGRLMTTITDPAYRIEVEVMNAADKLSTVAFARPVEVEIYVLVGIDCTSATSMPVEHETQIKQAIIEQMRGYPIGLDVPGWRMMHAVTDNEWIKEKTETIDGLSVRVGPSPGIPHLEVKIASNEIGVFDSTRITMVFA